MKTTKLILIVIFTFCYWSNANAQSHTYASGWCRLAKSGGARGESASLECPVCSAIEKKEKEAKLAETNRRNQAVWDKAKADKIAKDKAWKAKQLEEAENAHSGEVVINAQNNSNQTNTSTNSLTNNASKSYELKNADIWIARRQQYKHNKQQSANEL